MKTRNVFTALTLLLLTLGFAGCGDDDDKNCYSILIGNISDVGYASAKVISVPDDLEEPKIGSILHFQINDLNNIETGDIIDVQLVNYKLFIWKNVYDYGEYTCEIKPCK